jgi:FAD-linked oxidoreductase
MRDTHGPIRPVGAGHSFSPLVPTEGHLVITDNLNGLIKSDPASLQAEFFTGTRLADMGPVLNEAGQAMYNLPDIDHQTLAGALATSTHGTGKSLKSLSGYVTGLRLVTPGGDVLDIDKDTPDDLLGAASVSLGALGVVTRARLQNRTPFNLKTAVWLEETSSVIDQFNEYCTSWQHFEMMPLLHADYSQVIAHKETSEPPSSPTEESDDGALLSLIAATPVILRGTLINTLAAQIEPTELIQPSYQALSNLRFDRFNEMEYSVPVDAGPGCLKEILTAVSDNRIDVAIPLEYRIIDSDNAWLSMFSGGPRVSISVHRMAAHSEKRLFELVEPIFWKYEGRPHWGKAHSLDYARLSKLYPRLAEFSELQRTLDPDGKMLNAHLRKILFPD